MVLDQLFILVISSLLAYATASEITLFLYVEIFIIIYLLIPMMIYLTATELIIFQYYLDILSNYSTLFMLELVIFHYIIFSYNIKF